MTDPDPDPDPDLDDLELDLLLEAVRRRWGYDFRGYTRASLRRRAERLREDREQTFAELQHALLRDASVLGELVDTFTIQVSDMSRDPPFWKAFVEHVIPILHTYPRSTLWVAGSANGEELWSYAVLLAEHGLTGRVRLFATDLNPGAIRRSREGTFPVHRVRAFTTHWLATGATTPLHSYYRSAARMVQFHPDLLEGAVLDTHNLATDAAFIQAQVISCRNVLIYFDAELQERVLRLLDDSLGPHGVLCLGSRESLQFTTLAPRFDALDAQQRIFQRRS